MIQFSLLYGTRDKKRFYNFADEWLEPYQLDDKTKNELVSFVYEFLTDLGEQMSRTNVITTGIKNGVQSLEFKINELNQKLDDLSNRMPETY